MPDQNYKTENPAHKAATAYTAKQLQARHRYCLNFKAACNAWYAPGSPSPPPDTAQCARFRAFNDTLHSAGFTHD